MIYQIKEGKIVGKYESVAQASSETELIATNIYAVLRGTRLSAGGFQWEEKEEVEETTESATTSWAETGEQATFSGSIAGVQLTTLEEALAYCKPDLSVWEVREHQFKHWTTTMKKKILVDDETGNKWRDGVPFKGSPVSTHEEITVPNTSWTIKFAHKSNYKEKLVEMLLAKIAPVSYDVSHTSTYKKKYAVEFAIFDHHLGKDGFDPQTLKPIWSIDEAMSQYQKVIQFGLGKLDLGSIAEFWLPTGNDLLHTDSYLGTTTSGTKVDSDLFWLTLFRYGKEAVSLAIEALAQIAPVKAIFIPGNHDHNGVLSMSEVIRAMYQNNPSVEVICSGRGREWQQFGRNLIGWHHGNGCDPRKAHTMMIGDIPQLLETNQYRAVHVGHTHRSAKTETISLNTLTEEFGLVYEICPSLTPTDKWHDQNLYISNLRRSKIFGYEYDKGHEFEFIYNLGR